MAKIKHSWLSETARAFGMDITTFAECMGYSRQMLYQTSCGMCSMERGRLAVAIYKLEVINEKLYAADNKKADEMYKYRSKLLDDLEKRLSD